MYPTYPFMVCVSSLKNEVDDTVPKEPRANVFTLYSGQTVKNREHNIIKEDVSSINITYLCMGW